jgi:2-keto-4-pentenoate hydratase/2-oxohepta-3-ene-1,7-dioic acid hydratase in catechol pathway
MLLCTFRMKGDKHGKEMVGLVEGEEVEELAMVANMFDLIREGGSLGKRGGKRLSLREVVLHAPVPRPGKIIATIVNTHGMLGGSDVSLDRPRLDMKSPSTVIGPGSQVRGPATGIRPEVELAAILGRRISAATRASAEAAIFGYTVLNDVTAPADSREDAYEAYRRDKATGEIRKATLRGPLFRSKNHDTFCPMGPWIATAEEVDDWADLRMTTRFGGELVQDGSTSEYIFQPGEIASYVSQFLTLEPGDVVSCGSVGWTPQALGKLDPTEYVLPPKEGTLELEIEGIGKLQNPVNLR